MSTIIKKYSRKKIKLKQTLYRNHINIKRNYIIITSSINDPSKSINTFTQDKIDARQNKTKLNYLSADTRHSRQIIINKKFAHMLFAHSLKSTTLSNHFF